MDLIALLIDIGNSRIKWRSARLDPAVAEPDIDAFPRWISTEHTLQVAHVNDIEAHLRASVPPASASGPIAVAFVANVASEAVGRAVEDAVTKVWPGTPVRSVRPEAVTCGLANGYRDPQQLGVDRWLAAVAAHALHPDRSILVCTFGTATTIDLVAQSRFVGGLILPGVETMLNVLTTSTARLPARFGEVVEFGDRTEDAITSGVMAAQIGAVERALGHMRRRARPGEPPTLCVVAGGAAGRMKSLFDDLETPHRVIHDLVLRGLAHAGCEMLASLPT